MPPLHDRSVARTVPVAPGQGPAVRSTVQPRRGHRAPRAAALAPAALALAATGLAGALAVSPPAAAQPQPARLHVTIETNIVTLLGTGPAPGEIEVVRAGTIAATGIPRSTRPGEIDYAIGLWRAEPARVEPGDVVRVVGTAPRVEATVPFLRADFDEAGGRIVGVGPAGSVMRVMATYHIAPGGAGSTRQIDARAVAAPGDGHFAVDLPGAALQSGDSGDVTWQDEAGHVFAAPIAVFDGRVTIGQPRFTFRAAPGLTAVVAHATAGGGVPLQRALRTGASLEPARRDETEVHLAAPIAAGDTITVTLDHAALGTKAVHAVGIPGLDLEIIPQTDGVIGRAPPSSLATVTVRGPGGAEHARSVVAGPDGRVEVDFAGVADLDRGWRAEIAVGAGRGWTARAEALAGLVHVETDVARVWGDVAADSTVSIIAYDAAGREVRRWDTAASAGSRFGVDLYTRGGKIDAEVLALTAGMTLGVDLDRSGDPLLLPIPVLTALPDVDREGIMGAAPPGYRVTAEVMEGTQVVARSGDVRTGADGRYAISLAGAYDIEPGAFGRLIFRRPDGHELSLTWAAVDTRLDLDTGALWVNAPTSRTGVARLLAPGGAQRATVELATRRETGSRRRVTAVETFRDRLGRVVVPVPGDTVDGRIGDVDFGFRVPRLDGAAHVDADRVAGSTDAPPGTALRLEASSLAGEVGAVHAGIVQVGGSFAFDLAHPPVGQPALDLRYNARVTLRLDQRSERFSRRVAVPGLVLDLGGARLTGTLAPDQPATVRWSRAGWRLGTAGATANAVGAFSADLRDADGRRFDLQSGDTIAILTSSAVPQTGITLTVPTLDLAFDRSANAVRGRVSRTPGDRFQMETRRLQVIPAVLPDGRWDDKLDWLDAERFAIDFDDHPVRQPLTGETQVFTAVTGAVAEATLDLPDGQRVVRARVLPLLHLLHGGDGVCGQADPDASVDLRLVDASGRQVAALRAAAAPDGRFQARWRESGGGTVRMREGQRVEGEIDPEAVSFTLPPMTATFDWPTFRLHLRGLPDHAYRVQYPALWDCWGEATAALQRLDRLYVTTSEHETDAAGALVHDVARLFEEGATPAQGIQVDTLLPSLHRVFTMVHVLQAELHLGTAVIRGRTSPDHAVTMHAARAGTPYGLTSTLADGEGWFTARLAAVQPGGVSAIGAGDEIMLETDGDAARLVVPVLDFDFSTATGVSGVAAPETVVALRLRLADGRAFATEVKSDARGRFAFTPADLPLGEPWSLSDVQGVRAEHVFARHHRAVRDTDDGGTHGPPPGRGAALYLPWAASGPAAR